jgi:hypothetical protein
LSHSWATSRTKFGRTRADARVSALSSVAHNVAHHAASGLSWLHPHASRAARTAGQGELRFDLLASPPIALPALAPAFLLASEALREKSLAILEQHGFSAGALKSATLVMQFPTSDEYYCVTAVRIETLDGKLFEKSSSSLG